LQLLGGYYSGAGRGLGNLLADMGFSSAFLTGREKTLNRLEGRE